MVFNSVICYFLITIYIFKQLASQVDNKQSFWLHRMGHVAIDHPVMWYVGLFLTRLPVQKRAEWIELLFGVEIFENPRHILLDGGSKSLYSKAGLMCQKAGFQAGCYSAWNQKNDCERN